MIRNIDDVDVVNLGSQLLRILRMLSHSWLFIILDSHVLIVLTVLIFLLLLKNLVNFNIASFEAICKVLVLAQQL